MGEIMALTLYGVRIPKAFEDRKAAMLWAETKGPAFPGCRLAIQTARGPRTIWRQTKAGFGLEVV